MVNTVHTLQIAMSNLLLANKSLHKRTEQASERAKEREKSINPVWVSTRERLNY